MLGSATRDTPLAPPARGVEQRLLALDMLAKLTRQFAEDPSFERLGNLLLLGASGQFSVGSAFLSISAAGVTDSQQRYFGTGRYRDRLKHDPALSESWLLDVFAHSGRAVRRENFPDEPSFRRVIAECSPADLTVLAPLMHDGRIIGVLGLGRRLSGREFADADLELLQTLLDTVTPLLVNTLLFQQIVDLNARHRTILESVGQGVFVFDSRTCLQHLNNAAKQILHAAGIQPPAKQALTGATLDEVFPEATFPSWAEQIRRGRELRSRASLDAMIACHADAEHVYHVRFAAIGDDTPRLRGGTVVTLDDVTQQRASESRLFELEKFAEKGGMASAIAHELNNFVGLILGGVELSLTAIQRSDSTKAGEYLTKLREYVAQLERFTLGLMNVNRMQARKGPADLNRVITDVLSFATVQSRFKRIRVTAELADELPHFEMDVDQIAQLLLNLLNNATEAIAEKGIRDGHIHVSTAHDQDCVHLTVSDNGCGMPPEVKRQIFKTNLTTKPSGHGYGLVTCALLIANHNGAVVVDSEPGEGASLTISFRLP